MSQAIDETEIQSNDRVDRDPVDTPLRPRSKTEKIDFAICKALQAGDLHSQELFRIVKPEYNSIFYARLACLTEIGVVSRTKSDRTALYHFLTWPTPALYARGPKRKRSQKPKAQPKPKTKTETKAKTKAKSKAKSKAKTKAEPKAKNKPQAEPSLASQEAAHARIMQAARKLGVGYATSDIHQLAELATAIGELQGKLSALKDERDALIAKLEGRTP